MHNVNPLKALYKPYFRIIEDSIVFTDDLVSYDTDNDHTLVVMDKKFLEKLIIKDSRIRIIKSSITDEYVGVMVLYSEDNYDIDSALMYKDISNNTVHIYYMKELEFRFKENKGVPFIVGKYMTGEIPVFEEVVIDGEI